MQFFGHGWVGLVAGKAGRGGENKSVLTRKSPSGAPPSSSLAYTSEGAPTRPCGSFARSPVQPTPSHLFHYALITLV